MRILIVKTSSLGDIVQSFELLSYLRQKWPESQIDWVVEKSCKELLLRNPVLSTVIEIDSKKFFFNIRALRRHRYDIVYDIQGNCKSALILFFVRSPVKVGFGKNSVREWPNLLFTNKKIEVPKGLQICQDYLKIAEPTTLERFSGIDLVLTKQEEETIKTLLEHARGKEAIVVSFGSRWKNKQLSRDAILSILKEHPKGFFFFVQGSLEEQKEAEQLQALFPLSSRIVPKGSLAMLQQLMKKSRLVIAVDSLTLHLAATTGVATLSFFGPTAKEKFAPSGHPAFQGSCPYGITFTKRCPKLRSCSTGGCMDGAVLKFRESACHNLDNLFVNKKP